MLTEEEKRKIIAEEELRIRIRQEHYARTGCLAFVGKSLFYLLILGVLFWGIMIPISIFNEEDTIRPFFYFMALLISFIVATILQVIIFKRRR